MKPVVDLQDENKQPNPIIRKLVEIGSELLLLSLNADPLVAWQYATAKVNVSYAISCLMEAKNAIAREQRGEEEEK